MTKWIFCAMVAALLTACGTPSIPSAPIDSAQQPARSTAAATIDLSKPGDPAAGQAIFENGKGNAPACKTCHSMGSDKVVGPGLGDISTVGASRVSGLSAEDYIRHHILHPGDYIVPGYANLMPPIYATVLSAQDVSDIVAYLLSP